MPYRFTSAAARDARQMAEDLELIAAPKPAAPFEVDLTPEPIAHLRWRIAINLAPPQIILEVPYSGDEGRILRYFERKGAGELLLIPLDYLHLRCTLSFAVVALVNRRQQDRSDGRNRTKQSNALVARYNVDS